MATTSADSDKHKHKQANKIIDNVRSQAIMAINCACTRELQSSTTAVAVATASGFCHMNNVAFPYTPLNQCYSYNLVSFRHEKCPGDKLSLGKSFNIFSYILAVAVADSVAFTFKSHAPSTATLINSQQCIQSVLTIHTCAQNALMDLSKS